MNAEQLPLSNESNARICIVFAKECLNQSKAYRADGLDSLAGICLGHAKLWRERAQSFLSNNNQIA